jgi:cysteine desulfurase/selenocysteine lyase
VFSGHKLYGPTGIGVLYGKEECLQSLTPYQYGGEMILKVTFEETTYNELPHKFEAGTPNIAGAVGLRSAIDYLDNIDCSMARNHEMALHDYALNQLLLIPNIEIIGTAKNKSAIISFIIKNLHPHDIGTILNQKAVAVRTGHHCTMPLMDHYKISGTIRASFSFYNTKDEVDVMIEGLDMAINMLS